MSTQTHNEKATYCPACGYDLRGAANQRCSECGANVGRGISSRIPWVQRR